MLNQESGFVKDTGVVLSALVLSFFSTHLRLLTGSRVWKLE